MSSLANQTPRARSLGSMRSRLGTRQGQPDRSGVRGRLGRGVLACRPCRAREVRDGSKPGAEGKAQRKKTNGQDAREGKKTRPQAGGCLPYGAKGLNHCTMSNQEDEADSSAASRAGSWFVVRSGKKGEDARARPRFTSGRGAGPLGLLFNYERRTTNRDAERERSTWPGWRRLLRDPLPDGRGEPGGAHRSPE